MKIRQIVIHNFRSISESSFCLKDYTLLVGANNSGKSNIIDALRAFYEVDGYKWNYDRDWPKLETTDDVSWIDIEFELSDTEYNNLAQLYQVKENCLKVRKYFVPPAEQPKGIYWYTTENASSYSSGDVKLYSRGPRGEQKILGEVIYIPTVSHIDDVTKLSEPSALRNLLYGLIDKLTSSSPAFQQLTKSFEKFSGAIKDEVTNDQQSIAALEHDINNEIEDWGMEFALNIMPIAPRDVVKNLVDLEVTDHSYGGTLEPAQFGHGFQRHLIFTLLRGHLKRSRGG